MKTVAVIDLGTSSTKISIFKVDKKRQVEIFRKKIETGFGQELNEGKDTISKFKIENNIQVVKELLSHLNDKKDVISGIFSTEVLRKAKNSAEIVKKIKNAIGVNVTVLSHDQEAKIFFKGIINDFKINGLIASFDIGGGSTQFAYGTVKDGLLGYKLFPFGANTLKSKFIKHSPAQIEEYEKIEEFIRPFVDKINIKFNNKVPFVHGSSSVLDFYKESNVTMTKFKYSKSSPYKVKISETYKNYIKMRLLSDKERGKLFPSQPQFMAPYASAITLFLAIAKKTGLTYEVPSNKNITNGLVDLVVAGVK